MAASMGAKSAGLLVFRVSSGGVAEVLVAHPGGPFWARRDDGAWSVPKGEYGPDEDPQAAAYREFSEETGLDPPPGQPILLGTRVQRGGKRVTLWALEGDLDVSGAHSNTFESNGHVGRAGSARSPRSTAWSGMTVARARVKSLTGQVPFLDDLVVARAKRERATCDRPERPHGAAGSSPGSG